MKKPLIFTLILTISTLATYARGTHGGEQLNYGFTLLVVALIALYSAKLVADRQKQTKNKANN